jgi:hypothetical protein
VTLTNILTMTMTSSRPRLMLLAVGVVTVSAVAAAKPIALVRASSDVAESSLLDVHIVVLEPAEDFFPEVRRAESRYIPVALKRVFQSAGFWGSVRVVPEAGISDLTISGAVLASHGGELRLEARAMDATGKVWLDKTYKRKVDASVYLDRESSVDPFQDVYHQIANDVSKKYRKLKTQEIERIRNVARLRFASDLAPDAFADYVTLKKSVYVVTHLPSLDDPIMERVTRLRQRDAVFVDTVDAYYESLFEKMREPYRGWRSQDYWQREAMRNGPPSATGSGGRNAPLGVLIAGGGGAGFGQGALCGTPDLFGGRVTRDDETRWEEERKATHLDVLRELGASLAADVAPLVVDVDGRVAELTGSVEAQYIEWRALLKEIFAAETGIVGAAAGTADDN